MRIVAAADERLVVGGPDHADLRGALGGRVLLQALPLLRLGDVEQLHALQQPSRMRLQLGHTQQTPAGCQGHDVSCTIYVGCGIYPPVAPEPSCTVTDLPQGSMGTRAEAK